MATCWPARPQPTLGALTRIAPPSRGTSPWGIQVWKGVYRAESGEASNYTDTEERAAAKMVDYGGSFVMCPFMIRDGGTLYAYNKLRDENGPFRTRFSLLPSAATSAG